MSYADLRSLCYFAVFKMKYSNFLSLLKSSLNNNNNNFDGTTSTFSIEDNLLYIFNSKQTKTQNSFNTKQKTMRSHKEIKVEIDGNEEHDGNDDATGDRGQAT